MAFHEESVSTDPGPNAVPTGTEGAEADGPDEPRQTPVVGGLEAHADDPEAAEPLVHPQGLVGERPARGSVENPA